MDEVFATENVYHDNIKLFKLLNFVFIHILDILNFLFHTVLEVLSVLQARSVML